MICVFIRHLTHAYGERAVLNDLSIDIAAGEVFGLLGPNGSGKTTLFRILSTIIPTATGAVTILGRDLATEQSTVRGLISVVFQSPSLDKQLTARENLLHQGHLYGLTGSTLRARIDQTLSAFGLSERGNERVSTFSGGMRRRVEVAKSLLHQPRLLLMDEPSTGLDPVARIDLWQIIRKVSTEQGVTVLVTTHLMEEADRCDRIGILAEGKLLACDTPDALKNQIGGDVITLTSRNPVELQSTLKSRLGIDARQIDSVLRIEQSQGHTLIPQLVEAAPGLVDAVSLGKPTLEDVFIRLTGKRMLASESE